MKQLIKRSFEDLWLNPFLSFMTVSAIAFSVLMVSMFLFLVINAGEMIRMWSEGIRIMVYLKPNISEQSIQETRTAIGLLKGVRNVRFISSEEALEILKSQMERQASIFDNLKENPLPDAFEIQLEDSFENIERLEYIASQIEVLPSVEEVEYGRKWLGKFSHIFNLFKIAGLTIGAIFFIASMFFIANTIRLLLYYRRTEVEILKLVGATNSFIKIPFYFQSVIFGILGGILGLGGAFGLFKYLTATIEKGELGTILQLQFLPLSTMGWILGGCILVGWAGCFLSLKQFMKY